MNTNGKPKYACMSFFKRLEELRKETNHKSDKIDTHQANELLRMYRRAESVADFKKRAKKYLCW